MRAILGFLLLVCALTAAHAQGWSNPLTLRTPNGSIVGNCVDKSDNGTAMTNMVTIPAQAGTFYVIVTGGEAEYDNSSLCSGFTLMANY